MVSAFIKHGVRHVLIAPGSRNAPLSIAFAQAAGHITVTTRIDERTAAFTALGIAKRLNEPVVVLTTSGTAAAHLYAAVYEASEAGVPLILVTADRPEYVRGLGANQTIDQVGMFGSPIRADWDLPLAADQDELYWELAVTQAVLGAIGDDFTAPGPVHLNVPFEMPLVPEDGASTWTQSLALGALPVARRDEEIELGALLADMGVDCTAPKGVVVISNPHAAREALAVAEMLQWPVLAEPGSFARDTENSIAHYPALLKTVDFVESFVPDVIITSGRFGLTRPVATWIKNHPAVIAVGRFPLDADPSNSAKHHVTQMPLPVGVGAAPSEWLEGWRSADAAHIHHDETSWNAGAISRTVLSHAQRGDLVWIAASMSVRYAECANAQSSAPMTLVNRGTNGIDGLIASAIGASSVHRPGRSYLLIGDVAYLHDLSSLVVPRAHQQPELTIVVVHNNGGEIFKKLEQGDEAFDSLFDAVFGTSHDVDLAGVASAAGWNTLTVDNLQDLQRALEHNPSGRNVIVARCG